MGLTISSYTYKGVTYTNTYHRVTSGPRDKKSSSQQIITKIYPNKNYADANPEDWFDIEKINITKEDFETYLNKTDNQDGFLMPEYFLYELLKTIDPNDPSSAYSNCRIDYKNDSIDA